MAARTGFLYRDELLLHDTGPHHPERPARLVAIKRAVDQSDLELTPIAIAPAVRADLLRVHAPEHVDRVRAACGKGPVSFGPDTPAGEGSWNAALLAAGAGISAARAVLDGVVDNAFCAIRPPGHHAEADRAMGFCLFNNTAIAARWLQQVGKVRRIAILDWDVHHGNGTQRTFYSDPAVCFISLHQHPHYPGTGLPEERGDHGTVRNLPIPPGAPAAVWIEAIEETALPMLDRFEPEFLLISCGFDAHFRDPLGDQQLHAEHFAQMTRAVRRIAGGRIVSLLEGGYDLDSLAESTLAHLGALTEQP